MLDPLGDIYGICYFIVIIPIGYKCDRAVGSGTAGTALAIPLFNQGLVKFYCTPSV